MKSLLEKISGALMMFEKAVMLTALFGMLVGMVAAIVTRPLHIDVPWVTPFVLSLMIIATFAGAALATATRRHISMDLLSKVLEVRGRAVVSLITSTLGAVVSGVLAVAGAQWVMANVESGEPISLALKWPEWWLQTAAPLGFFLCAMHFAINALFDARALATKDYSHLAEVNPAAAHGITSDVMK